MPQKRKDIAARVSRLLAETDESNEYNASLINDRIDVIHKAICRGKVIRIVPENGKAIVGKKLPFLDRKTPINYKGTVTVTEEAISGATEILMDTTDLTSSGVTRINGCMIKYTSKEATKIKGVTGLTIDLKVGDIVFPLFFVDGLSLYKPYALVYQNKEKEEACVIIREDQYKPARYAEIINDGDDRYLRMVEMVKGLYRLKYVFEPATLATDETEIILPGTAGTDIIAPIVAGELLFESEETGLATEKLLAGYAKCIEFFDKYVNPIMDRTQQIDYNFITYEDTF